MDDGWLNDENFSAPDLDFHGRYYVPKTFTKGDCTIHVLGQKRFDLWKGKKKIGKALTLQKAKERLEKLMEMDF